MNGRLSYYADKSPSLPETLKFVIAQINKAEPDPALVDYALSQVFYSNAASTFIGRGQSIAYSIANGEPPEVVRKFRQAILKLRSKPNLANLLFERMKPEYAKVLPGLGVKSKDVSGGIYFVVGDEKQLSQYESYLKGVEGPATKIYRLYGRDYWID